MDTQLQQLGFEPVSGDVRPRLIAAVSGLEKQGKTHLALSAPGPIAVINMDIGLEGVVGKFLASGKSISTINLGVPKTQEAALAEWDRWVKAYRGALRSREIRTLVVDTETESWELIRMARFGKISQVKPHHYGPVNAEYAGLLREAYDSDKNLILLRKMKPKYVNDKRTAEYEPSGFSGVPFLVQVLCQVYRDEPDDSGEPPPFHCYIKDCRQNSDLAGMDLEGEMCGFSMLAQLVLPDVDLDVWEG